MSSPAAGALLGEAAQEAPPPAEAARPSKSARKTPLKSRRDAKRGGAMEPGRSCLRIGVWVVKCASREGGVHVRKPVRQPCMSFGCLWDTIQVSGFGVSGCPGVWRCRAERELRCGGGGGAGP